MTIFKNLFKWMTRLILDLIWFIFPEWLGDIIKNFSDGWVFQQCCSSMTGKVVAYRLARLDDKCNELERITLWIDDGYKPYWTLFDG